jgi:hypothetical protein
VEPPARKRRRRRSRGRRARATLTVAALLLTAVAIGLFVRGTPALSLRIPTAWRAVPQATPDPWPHSGELDLTGPDGARFRIIWEPGEISNGCDPCGVDPNLKPVDATLDGETVTLRPFPFSWGNGDRTLIDQTLLLGPIEHDFGGQAVYFTIFCHPSLASATGEQACADIVSSISWSAPLFANLRAGWAVIPIS